MDFIPVNQIIIPEKSNYKVNRSEILFELRRSIVPNIFEISNILDNIFKYLLIKDILVLSETCRYLYGEISKTYFRWTLKINNEEDLITFSKQLSKYPSTHWIGLANLEISEFEVNPNDLLDIVEKTRYLNIVNVKISSNWNGNSINTAKKVFQKCNEMKTKSINIIISDNNANYNNNFDQFESEFNGNLFINNSLINCKKLFATIIIPIILLTFIIIVIIFLLNYLIEKYATNPGIIFGFLVLGMVLIVIAAAACYGCYHIMNRSIDRIYSRGDLRFPL